MRVSWSGHVPSDWPVISRRLTGEELDQAIKDIGKAHAEDAPLPARNALLNALMYPDWDPDDGLTQDRADQLIDAAIAEDAEQHAVIADVPDDDQPTRAQASADKLRALFAGGCMPPAQYTATRGEPGGDA